jgi:hypothetical protein
LVVVLPEELPPIEPLVLGEVVLGELGEAGLGELVELLLPIPEELPLPLMLPEEPLAPELEPDLLK